MLACLLACSCLYPRLAVKSWPHPSPSPYHGLVSVSTRASGCEHASHPSTQQRVHSPHQECQFHSEASICRLRVVLVSCLLLVSRLICIWLLHRVTSALIRVSRPNLGLATHLPNIMVSYLPLLLVSYLRLLLVSVPFSQLPLLSQVPLFLSRSCISLSSRLCPYLFAATPRLACSFSQVSQLSLLLSWRVHCSCRCVALIASFTVSPQVSPALSSALNLDCPHWTAFVECCLPPPRLLSVS